MAEVHFDTPTCRPQAAGERIATRTAAAGDAAGTYDERMGAMAADRHSSDDRLTESQRAAVDSLTQAPRYAGKSKLYVFTKLPMGQKGAYFREHFLTPCVAAVIVIALCAFVIVRFVSPRERPALYAAVVDSTLPLGESAKLQEQYTKTLGQDVIIDDYFDTKKDGLSKLQTMISSEQIDVVIAPPAVFRELAGYGYFTNLKSTLPADEYGDLHAYAEDFHGFDDSALSDDVDDSGSGKGKAEPYGLRLDDAKRWHEFATDDAAIIGVVANTKQTGNAQRFIAYLYR